MMYKTTEDQKVYLYLIAAEMAQKGLSHSFIAKAVEIASQYEGIYELMVIWMKESSERERDETLADIQELIDEKVEQLKSVVEKPKLPFEKLEEVGDRVLAFKAELRKKVDMWGGISQLARATGIPQPSLSRFFSSASMPRRTTLYKIAKALDLSEDQIVFDWVA